MTAPIRLFDRALVRRRREAFAARFADHDFLVREVGERLLDRLADIRRAFPRVLLLGGHRGLLRAELARAAGAEHLVALDSAPGMLAGPGGVVADEELLPFRPASFDAVLGFMTLHWANDLPGALAQLRELLVPDGLLLLALPGGETLVELRRALLEAELLCEGGGSLRVSPMTDVRDAGSLLQRAGLALPVVDVDRITVTYAEPVRLMRELGRMGEGNALVQRRAGPLRRGTLAAACALYQRHFGDAEGRVPATFDILFLSAWRPHESQPRPLRRGSAKVNLADALRVPR